MKLTRRLVLPLAAAAVVLLTLPASADPCMPITEDPFLTIWGAGATFYVVQDDCAGDCWLHVGMYREMNGFPGLQREDIGYHDTCGWFPADPRVI
jgi:hypothetical protein